MRASVATGWRCVRPTGVPARHPHHRTEQRRLIELSVDQIHHAGARVAEQPSSRAAEQRP
jgi:hypothetical protein